MKKTLPSLYLLKFEPILKQKIWGGDKLNKIFNKDSGDKTGESWEISAVEQNISTVANGPLAGKSLQWVLENYKERLVGSHVLKQYGTVFPLLFKFIDAREVLSVQVHPGDALAKSRHNSLGKTEMWYILDSDADASIIVGFNDVLTKAEYLKALSQKTLVNHLHEEPVSRGDAFIINPGTVHAIGAGVLLAEIQQTSDITYRIYDWDRPDTDGKMRELHTDLALDAINFNTPSSKIDYKQQMNVPVYIGSTPYFEVNKLCLSKDLRRGLDFSNSFKVYMCIEGEAIIESNGTSEKVSNGETILVPSELSEIKFNTSKASFLEVYIP